MIGPRANAGDASGDSIDPADGSVGQVVQEPRAVFVGIAVLDVVTRVPARPQWGRKTLASSVDVAAGGPATNAAVACAALLGSATLVTAVGPGPRADLVRAELARHRVRLVDIAAPGWELPVSTCIIDPGGERTVLSTGATDSPVQLTDAGIAAAASASGLLVDGHHPRAGEAALRQRAPGCVAVLDAGSVKAHAEGWLPLLDVAAASADYAAGLGLDHERALTHALDAGAGAAIVTDGAGPVLWATREDRTPRRQTPPRVRVVDTLGAGDAFHGALLAGLVRGDDLAGAVDLAVRTASTRVAHVGARDWLQAL